MPKCKLTQSIAKTLGLLACLAMLTNPIVHAQIMADASGDWVLLCTAKGFSYVNINPDSDEEPPADIEQLSGSPCCVYDAAPDVVAVVFNKTQSTSFYYEYPSEGVPSSDYLAHYSPRAPPVVPHFT